MKLLYIEFIKYSRSRMFYGFMALYFALIILLEFSNGKGDKSVLNLPVIWNNLVYFISFLNFFIGLIAAISITNEYQYRTIRQHIVDGLNREQYFMSKYFYAFTLAMFTCVFVFGTISIIGMTHTFEMPQVKVGRNMSDINALTANAYHSIFENSGILFEYFLQLMGYMSLAIFLGFLFRSTAITSIFYIIYVLILEPLVAWAIFHTETNQHFQAYFPKTLFSSVVDAIPSMKLIAVTGGGPPFLGIVKGAPDHQTIILLACFYILIFAGGSYLLMKKRDV